MRESIEIIDLQDDIQKFHDVETSEFTICIISCIEFKNDACQTKLEKPHCSRMPRPKTSPTAECSLLPHLINVTTGSGTSQQKYDYFDDVDITDHLLGSEIITVANKSSRGKPALFVEKSTQSTQTDYEWHENYYGSKSDSTTFPNVFFCTLHKNGDVETFCNISCSFRHKLYVDCDSTVDPDIKVRIRNGKQADNKSGSLISLEKEGLQFIKDYKNENEFHTEKHGSQNIILENIVSEKNSDEMDFNLENKKGKYLLRNNKERKCSKKWSDMMEVHCPKIKSLKANILICEHCNTRFSTFNKLEIHSKFVHNEVKVTFKCKKCFVTFTNPHNLIRHVYNKHIDGLKKVLCDICGREFSRQDVLLTHKRLMHSDNHCKEKIERKQYIDEKWCKGCKKLFCRDKNLKIHQSGNLRCTKCTNVFICRAALKSHIDKNHLAPCSFCGNVYANERQLNLHKLKHSPKYECKYCNKGFSFEYQLTIHLATHTGNRPLMCEICGRSFAHKNSLHKHKWQEHTEANKKFKCVICGRGFVYIAKLESHLKSHSGNKPFVCHICPSSFSQKCSLAVHIKGIHGVYLHNEKRHNSNFKSGLTLTNKKIVSLSSNHD